MKRLWAAGVIAAVLIFLCWTGYHQTNKISREMQDSLLQIKSSLQEGNRESALKMSEETISEWQSHYGVLSTFIQHSRLEAIDQTLSILPPLISHGTDDQFEAECDRATVQIGRLRDTEIPSLENIL